MFARAIAAAFAFALCFSFGATPAAAQDQRQALATEVMGLMRIEAGLTDFFSTMAPILAEGMANELHLSPAQSGRLQEIIVEEFHAATPGMVAQMAGVYATQMSEGDLQQTAAFLRSPAGASFVATQTNAQAELERIGSVAGMQVGLRALTRLQQEQR